MKKTIFALLLLVALVAVLAIPAMAAEGTLENHCVCGDMSCDGTPSNGNDQHHMETWAEWDGTGTKTTGYWYLTGDVSVTGNGITPAAGTSAAVNVLGIDLNGHTIKGTGNARLFYLNNTYSKLILTDSSTGKTGMLDYSSTWKTYGAGINLPQNNVSVDMFGGTITGTRETLPTGGGAGVQIGDSAGGQSIFNMYGGTITGGESGATAANRGGGNVALTNGTFNMYGGTVSDGVAGPNGLGGNFFLFGGQVNVYDGAQILGGTATQGPAIYSYNGYVKLMGGVITSGQTDPGYAHGIYVRSEATRTLIAAGIDAIKLESDVPALRAEKPVELDLNGYTVKSALVRSTAANLKILDSKTADYNAADAGKISAITYDQSATAENVARHFVSEVNGQRYLVVKQGDVYSSHRIYLAVTHYVLTDDATALSYKTVLKCDDVVAGLVGSNYGVDISDGENNFPQTDSQNVVAGENVKTLVVKGFLKNSTAQGADQNEYYANLVFAVKGYITLADDFGSEDTIYSSEKATSYANVIKAVESMEAKLTGDDKALLAKVYADYNYNNFMQNWWISKYAA
ncbi:MAG: hypothetical protein J6Q53_04120 [Oscillospiraceae bacterium]|nr:hypothetical protein [Oscillospiraceae bacterium]